jgi:hypothetical protein
MARNGAIATNLLSDDNRPTRRKKGQRPAYHGNSSPPRRTATVVVNDDDDDDGFWEHARLPYTSCIRSAGSRGGPSWTCPGDD